RRVRARRGRAGAAAATDVGGSGRGAAPRRRLALPALLRLRRPARPRRGTAHPSRAARRRPPRRGAVGAATRHRRSRVRLVCARMVARGLRATRPGERCVVAGWPLGAAGRKLEAGTALWADGELLGYARATWIEPRVG